MLSKERLLNQFLEIVRIDSPSMEELPMAEWLLSYLKAKGIEATIDKAGQAYGGNSGNIVAHIKGKSGSTPICFAAHMDQISPCKGVNPVVEGNIVKTDGTTTLGADDKAGIASILEAVADIMEEQEEHRDLYLLFTVSEENGMHGAKNFDAKRLPCKEIVLMDAGGPTGVIAYKAPAMESIHCTFYGKKAHAGIEPEKGINAICVASDAISQMHIGRIDETTTSNIGRIEGGAATNIVTDEVCFTAEVRAHVPEKLQSELEHMENCCMQTAKKWNTTCKFTHENAYPSFAIDKNHPLFIRAVEATKKVGVTPNPMVIGGGSDANILAGLGYESVILSLGMYSVHTVNEYLNVDELFSATQIIREMMRIES